MRTLWKSLKWKYVVMFVAVIFIAIVSSGTFIFVDFRAAGSASAHLELREAADDIRIHALNIAEDYVELGRIFDTSPLFNRPGLEFNVLSVPEAATIVTTAGRGDDLFFTLTHNSSVIISALNGGDDFSFGRRFLTVYGYERRFAEFAAPFFVTDENGVDVVSYVMYVRKDVDYMFDNIARITRTIAVSTVLALGATVVVGVIFANTLTKPLAELTKKTKEFSLGHFPEEIPVYSDDEAGQLTESFNKMGKYLAETMSEIVREKNKTEVVLYNMTDGVLAYDASGQLIHCNNACYDLLNFEDISGMPLNDMLEYLGINLEPDAFGDDPYNDSTVFINDRYINAAVNPYTNADGQVEGVIIVLQDITRHKKLDNMRKEFVANVSHEIRTPITTIKSYVETLIDGTPNEETAANFLNVINGETDRMMVLVNDLLELSRSDDNRMDIKLVTIDLSALVEQNVESHKITAHKQNKTITFASAVGRADVMVDPDRVRQVLNNIISNAFKYSPENASVSVSVDEGETFYRVFVTDTGMGIPKEDQARIFERFYRVDKARSRAMGGTGLGLAIAKEIMEAHGGKISAISELGKGTTMILRFPK